MNTPVRPETIPRSSPSLAVVLLLTLLVGLAAISQQSLWIDEGNSALKAVQPNLGAWWKTMVHEEGSDLQMPLYMAYLWAWEKLAGHSEFGLRLANLPCLLLALTAWRWGFAGKPHRFYLVGGLTLTSPFLWSYLDEARPYVLLFAGTCLALASLLRMFENPTETDALELKVLFLGVLIICAANMIAVPWGIGFVLGAFSLLGPGKFAQQVARQKVWTTLFLAGLIGLAAYYLWTLKLGTHASHVSQTKLVNLLFLFYEQLGFGGLGPGRLAIRENGLHAFGGFAIPLLLAAGLFLPLVREGLIASWAFGQKHRALLILVVVFPFASVWAAGFLVHVRILGRHLMPLLPFLWLGIILGWERILQKRKLAAKVMSLGWLIMMILSCGEIRHASRHRKDDYRAAAAEAKTALASGEVWWAADESTGKYYGLSFASSGTSQGQVEALMNPDPAALGSLPVPNLIVLSKPDIYDARQAISAYAARNGFKKTAGLPAFELWKKSP